MLKRNILLALGGLFALNLSQPPSFRRGFHKRGRYKGRVGPIYKDYRAIRDGKRHWLKGIRP